MKDRDDAVERVLTGLRETEAPHDMERRVLAAVQMRSARHGQRRYPSHSFFVRARPWAFAAAIVVVTIAASTVLYRSHHPLHGSDEIASGRSSQVISAPAAAVGEALQTSPRVERAALSHQRRKSNTAATRPISDEDAKALSDMNAPSHPAPAMPLTEQEKLMLRILHKGDPVELAMLDPRMRSSALADSKSEFERFFAPPEPRESNQTTPDTQPAAGNNK